jgi:hypothetical protein
MIGFRAKGVSLTSLQFTKHQQPHHHRRHVSQLCCVLNNCIHHLSPDNRRRKQLHPARQDVRVGHDPSSSALLLAALRLPLIPTSSKPLSTSPLEPFISSLERSFEAGVSRQHCRLLGRTCCEISCVSPWYRLAALLHRGRSEPFPHSRFVPIQSSQRY